jgi:hypothetical protein
MHISKNDKLMPRGLLFVFFLVGFIFADNTKWIAAICWLGYVLSVMLAFFLRRNWTSLAALIFLYAWLLTIVVPIDFRIRRHAGFGVEKAKVVVSGNIANISPAEAENVQGLVRDVDFFVYSTRTRFPPWVVIVVKMPF